LLGIHRWSLLFAELLYSVLKRLLGRWLGQTKANALAPALISGLPNKSLELNQALANIASLKDRTSFLARYGHRSFSLDIRQPTFAELLDDLTRLARDDQASPTRVDLRQRRELAIEETLRQLGQQPAGWIRARLFLHLMAWTQRYVVLREEQRFYWQEILAFQRQLTLALGSCGVKDDQFSEPGDVFFATCDELRSYVQGQRLAVAVFRERKVEFDRFQREFHQAPATSYPAFLQGTKPWIDERQHAPGLFHGTAVSPGIGRGTVRVVLTADQLKLVQAGEVLVTLGADPGWTPVFSRISGLVLEAGGQLSHGAVVAREYGLPAVAGLPQITEQLTNGQTVVVDGTAGSVQIVNPAEITVA